MFSKPDAGWTQITVGDFTGIGSYLTDIPLDCLNSCIFALENNLPISIFFDEEGSEFILTSYYGKTHIIYGDEKTKVRSFTIDFRELASEIAADIRAYFPQWVDWLCEEQVNKQRTKELTEKLEKLQLLLG